MIQDYFTKWETAIPLPNQSAATNTSALINLFSQMGMPDAVHSDQGRNFESAILKQSLDAFGISKSHTTAYNPKGDGMVETLFLTPLMLKLSLTGRNISQLHCMLTGRLYMPQQECHHIFLCLVDHHTHQCSNLPVALIPPPINFISVTS